MTMQPAQFTEDRLIALERFMQEVRNDQWMGNLLRGGFPKMPIPVLTALSTADVVYRGCFVWLRHAGVTADVLYVCMLAGDGATYNWKSVVSG